MRLIATGCIAAILTVTASSAASDAEKGRALLEEVGKAYRNAPTITDTITLDLDGEKSTLRLRFDKDNKRVQFDVPGYAIMAIDGNLIVTSDAVPNKYMKAEIEGTLTDTLISIFGSPESMPFHFVMRDNRGIDEYMNSLTLGFLLNPRITGFTPAGTDGSDHHVLSLSDSHANATVHVDPKTYFIHKIRAVLPPIPGMDDNEMVATVSTSPVVGDELAAAITFDPGDREMVDSPDMLVPQMIEVGDAVPDFTLPALKGSEVSLSSLRGNVVVLDFWATWCIPCIRALPDVDRFAQWAKENDLPVKVYAVNVWEHRGETPAKRKEIVREFWGTHNFKIENLFDYDDSFIHKLGIDTIPTTVIIDPNGRVFEVHIGLPMGTSVFDHLKHAVNAALEEATPRE
jgi:cytochrome c biogenesis protein CcmG, thiol:disulfide interchange protein DsbE